MQEEKSIYADVLKSAISWRVRDMYNLYGTIRRVLFEGRKAERAAMLSELIKMQGGNIGGSAKVETPDDRLKLAREFENLPDGTRITGDAALLPEDLNCGFSETEIAYIATAGLAAWDACKGGIYYRYIWPCWRLTRNYNKPERWEIWQDEREHPAPMGRASYIQKAKKENRLARSTYTKTAPQRGATREVQCEHTFKITIPRCAPCGGYDKQCKHYRPKNK